MNTLSKSEALSSFGNASLLLDIPLVIRKIDSKLLECIWRNKYHYLKKEIILWHPQAETGLNAVDFNILPPGDLSSNFFEHALAHALNMNMSCTMKCNCRHCLYVNVFVCVSGL